MAKAESVSREVVRRFRRRGPTYLVTRGDSFFFQIRIPTALAPTRNAPPLGVRLHADSRQAARRKAMVLAACAIDAFERRTGGANGLAKDKRSKGATTGGDSFAGGGVEPLLETLRALERRLDAPLRMDDVGVDALIGMKSIGELVEIDREAADPNGHPLVRRNAELLRNGVTKRWMVATDGGAPDGLQPLMSRLAELQDGQTRLMERLHGDGTSATATSDPGPGAKPLVEEARLHPPMVDGAPLFSDVAREYIEIREGAGTTRIGTARYRLDVFIKVIGDRKVDEYRPLDLQRYVNELQYLPRDFRSDRPTSKAFEGMSAVEAIEANRGRQREPLGIKTIQDGYVRVVKATASFAATHHHIRHPFIGVKLKWPTHAKPSVQRSALDRETMDRVFRAGVASGYLDDALLLPLSFLTSRRIGLLAYLRGSDLVDRHGVTTVQVNGIVFDSRSGSWRRVPFKTDESLRFFVLHDLFRRIGFVDWAKAQGDAILFQALHQVQDPAAVASQRANRLLDGVGARSKLLDVAHSFRHGAKDLMSEVLVDKTSSRLQMGHEISGVHSAYGRRSELRRSECRKLATMRLPSGIDWSIFEKIDFEAMAARPRAKGWPKVA